MRDIHKIVIWNQRNVLAQTQSKAHGVRQPLRDVPSDKSCHWYADPGIRDPTISTIAFQSFADPMLMMVWVLGRLGGKGHLASITSSDI